MAKTLVVLNPVSGNGIAAKRYAEIEDALRKGGLDFDEARTVAVQDAIHIAEKAKRDGYENIIAVGGDGSVHEIVNGLMRASEGKPTGTLGIIPVGSGNDFVKMLPLNADWREGVRRVLTGKTRWFDVGKVIGERTESPPSPNRGGVGGEVSTHYFVNGLDTGFGALVAMHVHEVPFLQGTAMYLAGILKTLANYSVPRVTIELDHRERIEQTSTMVVVTIGRCFGGGFWIAPKAEVDDGLFDIIIAKGLGRIGILTLLPKVMKGAHLDDPRVRYVQASHVVIESPDPLCVETDGEIPYVDAHRLEIQVVPKALRVIV